MVYRVIDKLSKNRTQNLATLAYAHGVIHIVDKADEFLMLLIDFRYVDGIITIPFYEPHIPLLFSCLLYRNGFQEKTNKRQLLNQKMTPYQIYREAP
jgi:hypothetical protein